MKPPRYRAFGVPEYWIVDPAARSIEVYRFDVAPHAEVVTGTLQWQPDPGCLPIALAVGTLFDVDLA